MAFVQGCTGDLSTQIAVEASRTRALLEARDRLSEARRQKEDMLENLRNEIFRFATFFRHAVAEDISRHDPVRGVYEGQRFDNWMKLNDTSVLPTFQDKVFLQSTQEAAVHVMHHSSASLSAAEVEMIKRLAVLEDALPMADEYRRWNQVRAVVRRYAMLFNGLPTSILVSLGAFIMPAAMAIVALAFSATLTRSGVPQSLVHIVTITFLALSLCIALVGSLGPFVRAWIAARLSEQVAVTEPYLTATITSARVTAVLASLRQRLAALDAGFATPHETLPEQVLAPLRAEVAFLQAKIATRHLPQTAGP